MKESVKIDNYTVSYDIEKLIEKAKDLEWYEDEHMIEEDVVIDEHHYDEESWIKMRDKFIENIKKINESKIRNGMTITKAGKLHASKHHVVVSSDFELNYSDEYGSHHYDMPCIKVVPTSDTTASLVYDEIGQQESF
jgi:hypothetical protein